MEWVESSIWAVVVRSLWLAASGIVLWLCLKFRGQTSPATRAAASVLVLLQGWVWFAIPVRLELPWLPKPAHRVHSSEPGLAVDRLAVAAESPVGVSSDWRMKQGMRRAAYQIVTAIWLGGIVLLVGHSVRGLLSLRRTIRALPAAPESWQSELTQVCHTLSVDRPLELRIGSVAGPLLFQVWGTAWIVFPDWLWRSCSLEQRTAILRHELAHFQRRDPWRRLVVRLLALPHWFNPLAWWAVRQFESANEDACDDLACGGDPVGALAYSKVLLLLSERWNARCPYVLAVSGGSLKDRIRRLLHPEFRKESRMSRVLVLSALAALACLAPLRIRAADEPQAEDRPDEASLILNGGFEELQESGDPQSWFGTRVPRTMDHVKLAVSTTEAHGGERSVAVLIGDDHPEERIDYNWTIDAQGWQAGQTYELSGWIKVEDAARSAFIMTQFVGDPGMTTLLGGASTEKSAPVQGTADWTRVSTRFVVPEGVRIIRVRIGLSSQGNSGGKAWFDDLSLVRVTP